MTSAAEVVLVIDDDPAVGTVPATLLQQHGLGCRHAKDATAVRADS